jgi:biopolymer transport protein ExbB
MVLRVCGGWSVWLAGVAALGLVLLAGPRTVAAQEETPAPAGMPEPAAADAAESVPGMPANPAPDAAAAGQAPRRESPEQKTYLRWMVESSGPIGMVLFLMSFVAVGLTIKFVLEMRRSKVIPPELVSEFELRIKEKKYQEAYELARKNPSFLGKVLAAGMGRIGTGYAQAVEAMHEAGEDEGMRLEHRLSWLAILGTTGPLLGLVGTVEGIIASFRVIATSETQPKPNQLAAGISTSLFNTFEGLLVAILATVAFMLLKNQAARLVLEVGMTSGNLMGRLSGLPRTPRSPSAPTGGVGPIEQV